MINIDELKQWAEQWMYSRINEAVMYDTLELCNTDSDLMKAVSDSISRQYIVFWNQKISVDNKLWNTEIIVSRKRTYEAAQAYQWQKVAVLDFANYYSAWWAPFSAWAQEESMCRCSTLYPCIDADKNSVDYYKKHIDERHKRIIDNYGWDDIIYVPDVVVFKTDVSIPEFLDKSKWYKTDVIVSAAPELQYDSPYSENAYRIVMKKRVKAILDIAYREKVDILILWAFWCWAFENPPEIVAEIFKKSLENYNFKTVEFAIYTRESRPNKNFEIFDKVFNWK